MSHWVRQMQHPPRLCYSLKTDDPAQGPFLDTEKIAWLDRGEGRRALQGRIYFSASAIAGWLRQPGSPFVDPWLETKRLTAEVERLEVECADLAAQLSEAKAEIAAGPSLELSDEDIERIVAPIKNDTRMAVARAARRQPRDAA